MALSATEGTKVLAPGSTGPRHRSCRLYHVNGRDNDSSTFFKSKFNVERFKIILAGAHFQRYALALDCR